MNGNIKAEYMELAGRMVPVEAYVESKRYGVIPVLGIRMMSDERWQELCRASFLRKYEQEHGPQAAFPEQAYRAYVADLRRACADLPDQSIPVEVSTVRASS